MKKYRITLTEKQMQVVEHYLESYFRLMIGQDLMLSEDMCSMGVDLKQEGFDAYMVKRDHVREIMKSVFHIAYGYFGVPEEKSEDEMIAECIWDAIRFARGTSRWNQPFHIGSEPVPEIEVIEEE